MFPANAAEHSTSGPAMSMAGSWLHDLLSGQLALALATICVALMGFALLAGRIDWRWASLTFFGIVLTFGAPTIARGLIAMEMPAEVSAASLQVDSVQQPTAIPSAMADPYAGASVPG